MQGVSANFDFLGKQDAQLVRLGALAERYFKDDPNKDFVVRGAIEHSLQAVYVRRLQTTDSQADPNARRHAKNEALLAEE
jgi:hypothetical protein